MIQFNLLPDVKHEYLKTRRTKRVVVVSALGIAGTALTILILLFLGVSIFQKKHLNDLSRDITADSQKLQATPDLNKILTVQNQLKSLPTLHAQKPVASRLFAYLSQITPAKISIAHLDVDFDMQTMTFEGSADALSTVNKFVDTLKFTTFKVSDSGSSSPAFNGVVLSSFGLTDKEADYKVTLNFDPAIFDSANSPTLSVPQTVTTRSAIEKPSALFQPQAPATSNTKP